jgi:hypothetical protein
MFPVARPLLKHRAESRGSAVRTRPTPCRRLALLAALCSFAAGADEVVPPRLQASLIARLVPFDRSLVTPAQTRVLMLVAIRRDDARSQQVAAELVATMRKEREIAGLPLDLVQVNVADVHQLMREIRARRPDIVYLSTALGDEAPALAAGLGAEHLLTIAAESEAVRGGICVGFDLVSGKPRVLIHLQQAKKQHVNFQASLLHLAKVVDQ